MDTKNSTKKVWGFEQILYRVKKLLPEKLFRRLQPIYHFALAFLAALIYRFPSRKLFVVGVTGTKGKTSVVELVSAILEEAGYSTAIASTLRFKVGVESENNTLKMTMPGRFFLQRFLRKALKKKCDYVILEMTSEGAKQYRHAFIALNALIFTNLAPEHIESHGSYAQYRDAKLSIAHALESSHKKNKTIVANKDDKEGAAFLNIAVSSKCAYRLHDAEPYSLFKDKTDFTWNGVSVHSPLSGAFNIYNMLAAAFFAKSRGINDAIIRRALETFRGIPGRMQKINAGQDFTVIVDYAHTPDSLEKVYDVFQMTQKICVLGSTGGGRDKWKRKEMGAIASKYCSKIILTDEDPYDEDPKEIVNGLIEGISRPIYTVIMDRRAAIHAAFKGAKTGDAVLITGKGTDPYIMGPENSKIPWSDALVAQEELEKVLLEKQTKNEYHG
ncbi:MAG TPA: UDP-N-acetylmuramyl-tripeptide synthetase [Candidatus Paceibacterota bacterium]